MLSVALRQLAAIEAVTGDHEVFKRRPSETSILHFSSGTFIVANLNPRQRRGCGSRSGSGSGIEEGTLGTVALLATVPSGA